MQKNETYSEQKRNFCPKKAKAINEKSNQHRDLAKLHR
jgi:hypothetical protein